MPLPTPADLPLPSQSDAARDAAAPGFLAACHRAHGSLDGLEDVLVYLGLREAS